VNLTYGGLVLTGSGTTVAHLHGPALRGANAGTFVTLPVPVGTRSGAITNFRAAITPAQRNIIIGGLAYLNIHSGTHGAGEIRGQLDTLQGPGSKLPASSNASLLLLTLALAGLASVFLFRRRARA
jgi:hypothetical protein